METLILNLKFFLKIAGIMMSSYIGTEEASKPISQTKTNTIELSNNDTIEIHQDIIQLKADSVLVHLNSKIESNK